MARARVKLGQVLLDAGTINEEQLQTALGMQKGAGKKLGEVLVGAGYCTDEDIAQALAKQLGLEYLDPMQTEVAERIDISSMSDRPGTAEDIIQKYHVLPLGRERNRLKLLVHDPTDLEMFDLLRFRLDADVDVAIGSKSKIKAYIDQKLKGSVTEEQESVTTERAKESLLSESIDKSLDKSVDKSVDSSIDKAAESAPIIKLCSRILIEAVKMRASDVHIEPMDDRVRLRYRVDGVCIQRDNLPKRMQNSVLARLKLMSGMNIAERRVPQDGRIKLPVDEEIIDFRVSACPAYHGESMVLRILRPESVRIGLENLGFEADNLQNFNRIIRRPNGIFLVTGPTGSGKTTTLYSALDVLNRPDKKIITAEDPIEYAFTGINQCQVRESIGLTFSRVLRAMLRQAPNIILVGEIRDREVGEVAIQAALTGHLVFSTLHTNDAPSAITRLTDMGIKPFLVASSIQAVMAQRLIRVLCPKCKEPDPSPDPKLMHLTGITQDDMASKTIYRAKGCEHCNQSGYKGRKAIFELMQMNSELRELAFRCEPLSKVRNSAINHGMRTLLEDGKLKILAGVTAPDEIARVAQVEDVMMEASEEVSAA